MDIQLLPAVGADVSKIKKLFVTVFPPEERPPFFIMNQKAKTGKAEMLSIMDSEAWIGFVYIITYQDLAYLFFFAIAPDKQGMGYGTQVLALLKQRYHDRRLFLAREQLDPSAKNYDQRLKRHAFYKNAGFVDLPGKIRESGVTFDTMSTGCMIASQEYNLLMATYYGKFWHRFLPTELIE